jgi:hypothetical protein
MPVSGKYDFKGIKKHGATGLLAAISSIPWLSFLSRLPFLSRFMAEFIANWAANSGLIIMNVGYFYVDGELDQKALDRAIESGLKQVEQSGGNLTPEQIKEIDDAVIAAARKALPYGKPPKS